MLRRIWNITNIIIIVRTLDTRHQLYFRQKSPILFLGMQPTACNQTIWIQRQLVKNVAVTVTNLVNFLENFYCCGARVASTSTSKQQVNVVWLMANVTTLFWCGERCLRHTTTVGARAHVSIAVCCPQSNTNWF